MAKKTKKYADGGDIYEGTPLARAMGVRGISEPSLEEVYPEQYMGGVGSIKGVGGSAMKAAEEAMIKQAQKKALNRANKFGTGKLRKYSDEEKSAMGNKVNKFRLQEPPPAVRSLDDPRVLKRLEYKKGGAVKAKSKASSASKRADGIATKGKTRGRMI